MTAPLIIARIHVLPGSEAARLLERAIRSCADACSLPTFADILLSQARRLARRARKADGWIGRPPA